MSISLVASSVYQSTGNATVHTCPISPTPTAGHKLIAVTSNAGVKSAFSAGWTRVTAATDLDNVELDQFEKWSDGTETQFQVTQVSATACIAVYEFSGLVNTAADVAAHAHSGATGTSTPNTGTTSATAVDIELVIAAFAYFSNVQDTFTVPSGYTLLSHLASTNGAGSKAQVDTAYIVTSVIGAQTATASYSASRTHRGANIVTYKTAAPVAPGKIYPKFKQALLTQSPNVDLDSGVVKACIGRVADGFVYSTNDQYISDIVATLVTSYAAAVTVSGISATVGVLKSASPHIQFPVSTGAALDFVILFQDAGLANQSPLIAYIPLFAPITPVGGQVVQVDWDTGGQVLDGIIAI